MIVVLLSVCTKWGDTSQNRAASQSFGFSLGHPRSKGLGGQDNQSD